MSLHKLLPYTGLRTVCPDVASTVALLLPYTGLSHGMPLCGLYRCLIEAVYRLLYGMPGLWVMSLHKLLPYTGLRTVCPNVASTVASLLPYTGLFTDMPWMWPLSVALIVSPYHRLLHVRTCLVCYAVTRHYRPLQRSQPPLLLRSLYRFGLTSEAVIPSLACYACPRLWPPHVDLHRPYCDVALAPASARYAQYVASTVGLLLPYTASCTVCPLCRPLCRCTTY